MASLYELKEQLGLVSNELDVADDQLVKLASNPSAPIEDVTAAQQRRSDIQTRVDVLAGQIDREERHAKDMLKAEIVSTESEAARLIRNKAEFYRAIADKRQITPDVVDADFYGIPSGHASGGAYLLPTSMSNELVHEPFSTNPVRNICRVTNIGGLEVPHLAWTLADTTFLDDSNSGTAATMTGSVITFGRYKTKVMATASDTVVHGTNTNLVQTIDSALMAGLAAKEKFLLFTAHASLAAANQHSSFYQKPSDYTITDVSGAGMFEAVTAALADLDDEFQDNASIVMARTDYVGMLRDIAGDATLYAAPPENVLGAPVIFCSAATIPVVGDFSYCQINYDGAPVVDADKDVSAGVYEFVVTAWMDIWRLLDSAFRLAIDTSS